MRSILIRTVMLGLAASLAAVVAAKEIKWEETFDSALAAAKKSGKLVMVDFYTDWCGWCKKLDADTYPDEAVIKQSLRMINVKVNAEKGDGPALAEKYGVRGYPTILFLDGDGDVVGRIGGYEPPELFAKDMKRFADNFRDLPKLKVRLAKDGKDVEAAARLAAIYAGMGRIDQAKSALAKAEKADPEGKSRHVAVAHNAVGDYYQNAKEYDLACDHFEKALKIAKTGEDRAYARISIASCYFSEQKFKKAVPYLKDLLKQEDAPEDLKQYAEQMLEHAEKNG